MSVFTRLRALVTRPFISRSLADDPATEVEAELRRAIDVIPLRMEKPGWHLCCVRNARRRRARR